MNRPLDPSFDQRLADWLEDDPSTAPREVLGTVLAAFPSIDQRRASRVPWRFHLMNRYLLPVAAALIVALGAVYLFTRPASNVGPPAIQTPSSSTSTHDAPTLNGTACGLVTASEVASAGAFDALRATPSGPGPVGQTQCVFSTEAGDAILGLTLFADGGQAEFDAVKGGPEARPLAGIGDEAVWTDVLQKLDFRVGDSLVRIMTRPSRGALVPAFDFARSVAEIVEARL